MKVKRNVVDKAEEKKSAGDDDDDDVKKRRLKKDVQNDYGCIS